MGFWQFVKPFGNAIISADAPTLLAAALVTFVVVLGLLATLPDALKLIHTKGGVGPALQAWRGGREY